MKNKLHGALILVLISFNFAGLRGAEYDEIDGGVADLEASEARDRMGTPEPPSGVTDLGALQDQATRLIGEIETAINTFGQALETAEENVKQMESDLETIPGSLVGAKQPAATTAGAGLVKEFNDATRLIREGGNQKEDFIKPLKLIGQMITRTIGRQTPEYDALTTDAAVQTALSEFIIAARDRYDNNKVTFGQKWKGIILTDEQEKEFRDSRKRVPAKYTHWKAIRTFLGVIKEHKKSLTSKLTDKSEVERILRRFYFL
jgi:hypothetical protein